LTPVIRNAAIGEWHVLQSELAEYPLSPQQRRNSGPAATSAPGLSGLMQCSKTTFLFDHLIGAQAHDIGHVEAERLGGFEVEDELELSRLLP
jgi:hypothetical protein